MGLHNGRTVGAQRSGDVHKSGVCVERVKSLIRANWSLAGDFPVVGWSP